MNKSSEAMKFNITAGLIHKPVWPILKSSAAGLLVKNHHLYRSPDAMRL
jgi:hypothetical protein